MTSFSRIFLYILLLFHHSQAKSVIIVGAGAAGIAAAAKLVENNITDIRVFEAENRTGGRVYSLKFDRAHVDLGAEFCHGERGNVVFELAKAYQLLEKKNETISPHIYYSNGSRIESAEVARLVQVYSNSRPLVINETSTNVSMGTYLQQIFESPKLERFLSTKRIQPNVRKLLEDARHLAEQNVLRTEGSFSWYSSSAVNNYQQCEGNQEMTWKGRGYRTVLELLTRTYPDPVRELSIRDKIFLNVKVVKIQTNNTSGIIVTTGDGSNHTADFVIFTPSVGVVKKYKDTLFSPHLTRAKEEAIQALGSDGRIKVVLRFSQKFWDFDDRGVAFLWSKEDISSSSVAFPNGPCKNGVSWITHISHFVPQPASYNPNVAMIWIFGPMSKDIEVQSEEVIQTGIEYVLNKFLGRDYNLSTIEDIYWSKWSTNTNFLGAYSYLRAGYYRENLSHNEILSQPITNPLNLNSALLFAGEATNPVHYSTVHGAIETGYREANRIIQHYSIV